jgi:hypothetical protein
MSEEAGSDSDDDMPLLARALAQKAPGPAPRGVEAAVPSGGADVETWLGKTAAEVGQMLVGCSITKLFPKYGYFKGEVESFDAQTGMFAVVYEDNDEEMMTLAQLAHCLPKAHEKLAREYLGLPKLVSGQALGGGAGRGRRGSGGGVEAANAKDRTRGGKRAASPESGSDVEFVEEEKKAPDVIDISDSESDYSSAEEDSENSEWEDHGSSSKGQAKIKVGKVTIEAFCIDVDDEHGGDGGVKEELGRGDEAQHSEAGVANEEIRKKIRKMLQLGLHPDTPDNEAQQALKNANRFLTRYNLQQVDILKEAEEEGQESSLAGGMKVVSCPCNCAVLPSMHVRGGRKACIVQIWPCDTYIVQVVKLRSKTAGRKAVNNAAWISRLGNVVSNCFDCCYYTQHGREDMSYVFYGVVTNAECAVFMLACGRVDMAGMHAYMHASWHALKMDIHVFIKKACDWCILVPVHVQV